MKLIIRIRDPVDRAWSHYFFWRDVRVGKKKRRTAVRKSDLTNPESVIVKRGEYARYIQSWFREFPREQILILQSEKFFNSPEEYAGLIAMNHLGMNSFEFKETYFDPMKPAYIEKQFYPPAPDNIKRWLENHYRSKNEELSELLGWNPSWKY